jgi:hypothetical protein
VTTVYVHLTQNALDTMLAMRAQNSASTLADNLDLFFLASHSFSATHPYYASANLTGSTGRLDFSDGAYQLYTGIVDLTPAAFSGHATATGIEEYSPNAFRLSFGGKLTFDYSLGSAGTSIIGTGGTITDASMQTLVPASSSAYSTQLGNVTLSAHGSLLTNTQGDFSGTINSFDAQAERLVPSSNISGNFKVSGNGTNIGLGLSSTTLSGTLTGLSTNYTDGSYVTMSGASLKVTGASVVDERMLFDTANFGGNDMIEIMLSGHSFTTPWAIAAGAGDDIVTLMGGLGTLSVDAGSGNDQINLLDHGHAVDGGDGHDIVHLVDYRSGVRILKKGDTYLLIGSEQRTDVLQHVEKIRFVADDVYLSLEYDDVVQALYVAYFGRAADAGGLANFQQRLIDLNAPHDFAGLSAAYNTNAGIRALIDSFGGSDESKALYSGDTTSFVSAIYKNVLSRAPDAEGLAFWVDAIDHHGLTKANASLSIMAGALSNTTAQGKLDAALIGNRTTIASDFSFALNTTREAQAYSGDAAAAAVRAMLATVTASTDLDAFQTTVQATIDNLAGVHPAVGLVGIPGHDGLPLV